MSTDGVARSRLLTAVEVALVDDLAKIYQDFCKVIEFGPSRPGDLAEVAQTVHVLQNMVLAQAAARAYPGRYRLMGGVVEIRDA